MARDPGTTETLEPRCALPSNDASLAKDATRRVPRSVFPALPLHGVHKILIYTAASSSTYSLALCSDSDMIPSSFSSLFPLALSFAPFSSLWPNALDPPPTVRLDQATVYGATNGSISSFLNIPFAQPPHVFLLLSTM